MKHFYLLDSNLIDVYVIFFTYFCVVIIGHLCLSPLMKKLNYDKNPYQSTDYVRDHKLKEEYARKQSGILGIVERTLYLFAFQAGLFGFVAVWLTLKTVLVWKKWKEDDGRIFFNNFLIGSGINLLYSYCGFLAIRYSESHYLFTFLNLQSIGWLFFLALPYISTLIINCYLDELDPTDKIDSSTVKEISIVHEKTHVEIDNEITKISK